MSHRLLNRNEIATLNQLMANINTISEGARTDEERERVGNLAEQLFRARPLVREKLAVPCFSLTITTAAPLVGEVPCEETPGEIWVWDKGQPLPRSMWTCSAINHINGMEDKTLQLDPEGEASKAVFKLKEGEAPSKKTIELIRAELSLPDNTAYVSFRDRITLLVLNNFFKSLEKECPSIYNKIQRHLTFGREEALTGFESKIRYPLATHSWANTEARAKKLFAALNKWEAGQYQWDFDTEGEGEKNIKMVFCPDLSQLNDLYPGNSFHKLTGYDWLVYSACFSAWRTYQKERADKGLLAEPGATFTYRDIYKLMGKKSTSTPALEKIGRSIDTMARIVLRMEYEWRDKDGRKQRYKHDEPLLLREAVETLEEDGTIKSGRVRLAKIPIIFGYLKKRNLLRRFPLHLLTIPSDERRASDFLMDIRIYLINEIISMRASTGRNKKILLDTLCDYIGTAQRSKEHYKSWHADRQRIKKHIEKALTEWEEAGWISGWTAEGRAETFGYKIDPKEKRIKVCNRV
jgi:hypothetical protein